MKYYFKVGRRLAAGFAFTLLFISYAVYDIFFSTRHTRYLPYIALSYIFLLLLLSVVKNYRFIGLALRHQPIIEVDEHCIFDCATGIKYYWNDIKEVVEEGMILQIKVTDAGKYLSLFKNRYSRYLHYSKLENHFRLNVDCINSKREMLIETLTAYSFRSEK